MQYHKHNLVNNNSTQLVEIKTELQCYIIIGQHLSGGK